MPPPQGLQLTSGAAGGLNLATIGGQRAPPALIWQEREDGWHALLVHQRGRRDREGGEATAGAILSRGETGREAGGERERDSWCDREECEWLERR